MSGFIAAVDAGHLPAREDPYLALARHQAASDGYNVSFWQKRKALRKFGRTINADSGTKTEVAIFQDNLVSETYATTNTIDSVISSSTSDTTDVQVQGHYLDGNGDWIFHVQTVTLQGRTAVPLTQPLVRGTRLQNAGAVDFVGNIYLYDATLATGTTLGVPDVATATKVMIRAGENQSEKCSTTISGGDVWAITFVSVSASRGNATVTVDYEVEYRRKGGVWLPLGLEGTVRSSGAGRAVDELRPVPVIYPNSDVRLVVTTNADNTICSGRIAGILGSVST